MKTIMLRKRYIKSVFPSVQDDNIQDSTFLNNQHPTKQPIQQPTEQPTKQRSPKNKSRNAYQASTPHCPPQLDRRDSLFSSRDRQRPHCCNTTTQARCGHCDDPRWNRPFLPTLQSYPAFLRQCHPCHLCKRAPLCIFLPRSVL